MDTNTRFPCPNHLIHQHVFPELSISHTGMGSNQQPYFRAMIFFNKKPGVSDEFFHEHWKSVHADLTMQVDKMGRKNGGVVRYVQFHQTQSHITALAPLLEANGGTMRMVSWDGAAEFWAETAEDFVAFMKGVYGAKNLVGCGTRFVDLVKGYEVMGGYDTLILGRGVPEYGRDGILETDRRLKKNVERREKVLLESKREDSGVDVVMSTVEVCDNEKLT